MKNIKNNWWKTSFDNNFYKIYYHYLKKNFFAYAYIDKLVNFANLKKENMILDIACGSGEHLMALNEKGFKNIEGLDYNYARIAQKNTKKYKISIKKRDMRKRFGKNIYDFIMLSSSSFGYFNDRDNKKVLINCYEALKPKGKLFIDNLSREFIADNFHPKSWNKFQTNVFLLEERWWSKDKKNLLSLWYLIEKNRIYVLLNKLRLYSVEEFKNLFYEIGFKKIKIKKKRAHNWFLAIKK